MRRRVMLVAADACGPARACARRRLPPKACSISSSAARRSSRSGRRRRRPNFFADPFGLNQQPHQPAPAPRVAGSGPAFCVRSCDGKYFPLTLRGNATPVQMCQAFCPASATKVYLRQQYRRRVLRQRRALCRQRERLCLSQGAARRLHLQRPRSRRARAGRSHARHLAAPRRRDRHHRRPGGLYRHPARRQPDRGLHPGRVLSGADRRRPRPARRDEGGAGQRRNGRQRCAAAETRRDVARRSSPVPKTVAPKRSGRKRIDRVKIVIASAMRAIQLCASEELDCFASSSAMTEISHRPTITPITFGAARYFSSIAARAAARFSGVSRPRFSARIIQQ